MLDSHNRKMHCILWFSNSHKPKKGEMLRFWACVLVLTQLPGYVFGNAVKDYIAFVHFAWHDLHGRV